MSNFVKKTHLKLPALDVRLYKILFISLHNSSKCEIITKQPHLEVFPTTITYISLLIYHLIYKNLLRITDGMSSLILQIRCIIKISNGHTAASWFAYSWRLLKNHELRLIIFQQSKKITVESYNSDEKSLDAPRVSASKSVGKHF